VNAIEQVVTETPAPQVANGDLSITQLIIDASPLVQGVMLFLLILSVVSWTVIIQRGRYLKYCSRMAVQFENEFWGNIDLNQLYQNCKSKTSLSAMEKIFTAGFTEFARMHRQGVKNKDTLMDGTYRAMKVSCSREIEALENHLPTLATIGSISPYIGLFGTVWGIMSAFVALSAVKNATLAMVAPPIAEALIATAMGLFAAIPAVLFYNRYATKVEKLENQYLNFIDEFSTILNRNTASSANNQQ
jgi:biopolymer transport protein TolQ